MSILFLTIFLCLSNADVYIDLEENSTDKNNHIEEKPYNIHQWIQDLQLQTCALVAIGFKYFAIFVENISVSNNTTLKSTKYFIGICHQSTLETWEFCSPALTKNRKHKCRFKIKSGIYQQRVNRRFCDLGIMINNPDCICENTSVGEDMFKVRGFPTCYIPTLPHTLCKYNVCGLSGCEGLTESGVHSVRCDPQCIAGNPFCEGAIHRSSRPPEINSLWSKWSRDLENASDGESEKSTMKSDEGKNHRHRSVSTCINKYTGKPDLDCLGPGTGCCPRNLRNCSCNTFEADGGLKVERLYTEDEDKKAVKRRSLEKLMPRKTYRLPFRRKKFQHEKYRLFRDTTDDDIDDIEDDENVNSDDLGDDIVMEEDTEPVPIGTSYASCEPCEKGEIEDEVKGSIEEEKSKALKNNTITNLVHSSGKFSNISRLLLVVVINLSILNKFL